MTTIIIHDPECPECLALNRYHKEWCHVGGRRNPESNYGWPHVVTPESPTSCVLCGAEVTL